MMDSSSVRLTSEEERGRDEKSSISLYISIPILSILHSSCDWRKIFPTEHRQHRHLSVRRLATHQRTWWNLHCLFVLQKKSRFRQAFIHIVSSSSVFFFSSTCLIVLLVCCSKSSSSSTSIDDWCQSKSMSKTDRGNQPSVLIVTRFSLSSFQNRCDREFAPQLNVVRSIVDIDEIEDKSLQRTV